MDFGIAAWQQAGSESELSPTLAISPAYASPEQIRGDKTNSATDIYSLGLVSYELLSGMPPFGLDEMALNESCGFHSASLRILFKRAPKAHSPLRLLS